MKEKVNKGKVNIFQSLAFKVMICVLLVNIIALVAITSIAVTRSQSTLEDVYMHYTKNVAEGAANTLNIQMQVTSENVVLDDGSKVSSTDIENYLISLLAADPEGQRESMSSTFEGALGNIVLDGVDGSYAYFVSADGLMVYHPTMDKIGASVENAAVKGLVSRLQAGESAASIGNGSVIYEFKGALKYAGYAFTAGGNIVLVTGDYDTVMSSVYSLRLQLIITTIISILVVCIVIYLVITRMLSPLKDVNEIINDTANFNFKHNAKSDVLCKRKDEIGQIANNVRDMRAHLRDIIHQISDSCGTIVGNVTDLRSTTDDVNNMCTDNSATTQELSAAMEETSASTDMINSNIGTMMEESEHISELSAEGSDLSDEVMDRATSLRVTTEDAMKKTRSMYESVRVKSDEAIENSKVVEKINELTNTIMSISSQTSLLALNASIEAARAGDAGRGFAVVATEIGSLADQTATSVQDIDKIVAEVNVAVQKMSDCLAETTEFLEKNVLSDYDEFQKVSEQYHSDADRFKESMLNIKDGIGVLSGNISTIATSVSDIGTAINESAKGVSDIAEKTTDIVGGTSTTMEKVTECGEIVDDLNGIVDLFVLE